MNDPLSSDLPIIVYSGGLDPFVSPAVARKGLAGAPHAFLVVTPAVSVPVATIAACPMADSRNEFLADPTRRPDTRCQEHAKPTFAASPL